MEHPVQLIRKSCYRSCERNVLVNQISKGIAYFPRAGPSFSSPKKAIHKKTVIVFILEMAQLPALISYCVALKPTPGVRASPSVGQDRRFYWRLREIYKKIVTVV